MELCCVVAIEYDLSMADTADAINPQHHIHRESACRHSLRLIGLTLLSPPPPTTITTGISNNRYQHQQHCSHHGEEDPGVVVVVVVDVRQQEGTDNRTQASPAVGQMDPPRRGGRCGDGGISLHEGDDATGDCACQLG